VGVAVVGRTTIAKLTVWDAATRSHTELAPGAAIGKYRIHRHCQAEVDGGAEPYAVRFESNGREYSCALAAFQARTQSMGAADTADAVAV
jgi:hypothetical protein